MKKYLFIILMIVILSLAACGPTAPAPEEAPAEAPAEAAAPEEPAPPPTEKPTEPPPPTETSVPTETPIPTETPLPTVAPYDGPERIVFSSNRSDPAILDLYVLDLETQEISPVNTGFEVALFGRWSPDGHMILFTVANIWNLYTILPDGTDLTQLTDFSSANADWSPDGGRIVFQSDHDNEPKDTPDIYVIDSTGENMVEILDAPEIPDYNARWSPDGEKILFTSNRTEKTELFTIGLDGAEILQVTESEAPIGGGEWSPDGSRIVFTYGGFGLTDLYVVDADGVSNMVRLTSNESRNQSPSFSPDGSQIVFSSDMGGVWDLWTINADGNDLMQLTNDEYYNVYPNWSP
jgi:Tol biopolymer transport system component